MRMTRRGVVAGIATLLIQKDAMADVVGGAYTSVRREYHREDGDWRTAIELLAPGYAKPYWGWFQVNEETLKAPEVGTVRIRPILVTDDGKPVRYARWSTNPNLPIEKWTPINTGLNGFEHELDLSKLGVGAHTIHYVGAIKDGQRNYTKVWVLVEITIGGKKKDRRMMEAIQFFVYDLDLDGEPADRVTLSNAQEEMGAGGSSLVGPSLGGSERSGGDGNNGDKNDKPKRPAARPDLIINFVEFSSWARVVWDTGKEEWVEVDGKQAVKVPKGATAVDVYIVNSDGEQGGYRVKNKGAVRSYDLPSDGRPLTITVNRTRRSGG